MTEETGAALLEQLREIRSLLELLVARTPSAGINRDTGQWWYEVKAKESQP